jgi:cellulose/xylan binding protein with CBM9 domain
MFSKKATLFFVPILSLIFVCESCTFLKNSKSKTSEKIETEDSIGLDYPARVKDRALAFNGGFKLGTAGFAIKNYYELATAFRKDLPVLTTTKREDGKGECLEIESVKGSPRFILLAREVYVPKKMKLTFTFEGRLKKTPGADETLMLGLDFRYTKPGRIRKGKYFISGGRITLTDKWQKKTITVKAPKAGYYRYFFFTLVSPKNLLPTVLLSNISLKPLGETTEELLPQAAIYTDKTPPAYRKGEAVNYTIKAQLPEAGKNSAMLKLVFFNEQTKKIVYQKEIELKRNSNGIFEKQTRIIPPEYGPFGALVKYQGKIIDSFGGETMVLHPVVNHKRGRIGWRIGANYEGARHYRKQPESDNRMFFNVSVGDTRTPQDMFDLFRLSGIQTLRTWYFSWAYIEAKKGKQHFEHLDSIIDLHRKYQLDMVGVLGPSLHVDSKTKKVKSMPDWVQAKSKPHNITPFHPSPALIPPNDLWIKYCDTVMRRYQGDAAAWELLNEPKSWCSTEEYMELLKATRKAADSISPDIKIIGPCPTGDGDSPRFIEFSKRIIDAGGEKYIDGFSFHPYGSGNDFQNGNYFWSTNQIKKIRSLLVDPKRIGLWNTECFQLSNKKYMRCDRWNASTAIRHYLLQLGNNVKLVASFDSYEFRKDRLNPHVRVITPWVYEQIPAPVCAALNFLSYKLKDATKAQNLNINSFARTYVFSNQSGEYALGVAWYLRPDGCRWKLRSNNKNITFFDMFGNELNDVNGIKLGYDPVYISGTKTDVENCLKQSIFAPCGNIVDIKGRIFKKTLFLNAKNNLGKAEKIGIKIDKKSSFSFPGLCEFAFSKNIYCSAMLPDCIDKKNFDKSIQYQVYMEGKYYDKGKIEILSNTKCYDLPFKGEAALETVLNKGSKLTLIADKKNLCITVKVKDDNVIATKSNLWEGDAVEIFVDCNPLSELDVPSTKKVRQYVFSARPAINGALIWDKLKSKHKAVAKSTLTKDGYIIEAKIPWQALLSDTGYFPPLIYGIEVAVDQASPGKGVNKETLSGKNLPSFKQRFHYSLFKLPSKLKDDLAEEGVKHIGINGLKNSSLISKGKRSMPTYWWLGPKGFWQYGDFGLNGKAGVKMSVPVKRNDRAVISMSQKLMCEKFIGKEIIIEILAKSENLQKIGDLSYNPGLRFMVSFYGKDGKKSFAAQGIGLKKSYVTPFGWSILQFTAKIPENAYSMTVHCGFSRTGCAGDLCVSHVYIKSLY